VSRVMSSYQMNLQLGVAMVCSLGVNGAGQFSFECRLIFVHIAEDCNSRCMAYFNNPGSTPTVLPIADLQGFDYIDLSMPAPFS